MSKGQSEELRMVDLIVSDKQYRAFKMFGTELSKNSQNEYKDVCSGDSGNLDTTLAQSNQSCILIEKVDL